MWRRVDFYKFALQLLPTVFRGKVMMAMIRAMVRPLRVLYDDFVVYRTRVDNRLRATANVQYIQKVLNDAFFLKEGMIYLVTPEGGYNVFYFKSELRDGTFFYNNGGGRAYYLTDYGGVIAQEDFIVRVPTFLCTSLDKELDEYGGRYIQKIQELLVIYKPAGRSFRIELYDYE